MHNMLDLKGIFYPIKRAATRTWDTNIVKIPIQCYDYDTSYQRHSGKMMDKIPNQYPTKEVNYFRLNNSWIMATINSILEVSKLLIEMILLNLMLILSVMVPRMVILKDRLGSPCISQLQIYRLYCE